MPECSDHRDRSQSGIGAAISVELAERGYAVVGLSRSGAAGAGRGMRCDVADHAAVHAAFAEIAAAGPVRGLGHGINH